MEPVSIINPGGRRPLVLTCEHASCAVPAEYDDLGLDVAQLHDHIGLDIGARQVTEAVAELCDGAAVVSAVSRLLIDCNRALSDHDLIVAESHGIAVPGNLGVDDEERERRIREFYTPYHDAIDAVLGARSDAFLLSVHSFTPVLNGRERRFDIGVLFDTWAPDAERVAGSLAGDGLRVRHNEPYSAFDGLIFSARTHGERYGVRYLEIEINNGLLRTPAGVGGIATAVARAVAACLGR